MKAVILSAGYGSRIGAPVPKSLIKFSNGQCLLDYQLAALTQHIPIHDIYIVVGFKKELVMEAAPRCNFLYNDRFDTTNTAKSLLVAMERIDDDIIWMNGDVFFETEVLERVVEKKDNLIVVNSAPVSDEEVCYTTDEQGAVVRLAKQLSTAEGEALGINRVCKHSRLALAELCQTVNEKDYFERAIELGIEQSRLAFRTLKVDGYFVKEMDFKEDYERIDSFLNDSE